MINRDRILNEFIELVKIDSLSGEEREIGNRILKKLHKLDVDFWEDEAGAKIEGNCGNIIVNIPGDCAQPTLLLSAHLDRVEPGRGIEPIVKNGYIYSKGETVLAGDDLIGVVSLLEAIRFIIEKDIKHPPIRIVFTVAEEVGMLGAQNLAKNIYENTDFGIVLDVDGPVGTIVYSAPSRIKFNSIIHGKAAHAGMAPECGVNAIKITSHALSEMNLGKIDQETTANIGVIRGGVASNVVPDLVELEGEARSFDNNKLDSQVEHMQHIIDKYVKKYGGKVEYDIDTTYHDFSLSPKEKIVELAVKAARGMGLDSKLTKSGGGSDANILNKKGLPTINLGTGMENVHSTEERVKISAIYRLTEYVLQIIQSAGEF